jgi:allantoin racemase
MKHIRLVGAFVSPKNRLENLLQQTNQRYAREDLTISVDFPDSGPELETTESLTALSLSVPDLIKNAVKAEREDVDGIMVNCMADPGVQEMRESVSIPVLGPGHTSMHVAALLGRRFSLLVTSEFSAQYFREQAQRAGLSSRLASCQVVGIPVTEISTDAARTAALLAEAASNAIVEAHADTLVICCTGFAFLAEQLQEKLASMKLSVPVIDPVAVTINMLAALIDAGLTHSRIAYPDTGVSKTIT